MKAFVLNGPLRGSVHDVPAPDPGPGEVLVEVLRVGLCGTDVEFFTGEMAYLEQGHAAYPIRLGHEWCGRVVALGEGVDVSWSARLVTGDTMLGCGDCRRCRRGHQHLCADRFEVGIRGGRDGALAELLTVPASSLCALPDDLDPALGALVEPGGNALRAARAALADDLPADDLPADLPPAEQRVLVMGPGTIGLLAAMFLRSEGAEVHLLGPSEPSLDFARGLGFAHCWSTGTLPSTIPFDAVVDASNDPDLPAFAAHRVEPGGRLVLIGLAGTPSRLDTRDLVLADVTCVGILSASPALADTAAIFASGRVDPRPLVSATVRLDQVGNVLAGRRPGDAGPGPKVHVAPNAASHDASPDSI